jgi:hypothetical protein
MKLFFENNTLVPIQVTDTAFSLAFQKIMKNLQYVTIPFRKWDNPYYLHSLSYKDRVEQLIKFGKVLGIEVDFTRLEIKDPSYFNELHKIYELTYPAVDSDPRWLDYHEFIHLSSAYSPELCKYVTLNYREKGGLLEQPMKSAWLETLTPIIPKGSVYISWAELGKMPFHYWESKEPDDFDRLCQLAKPWVIFKPHIQIAFEDIDQSQSVDLVRRSEFNVWWDKVKQPWCKHWGIDSWEWDRQWGSNIIGHTDHSSTIQQLLQNNQLPTKLTL